MPPRHHRAMWWQFGKPKKRALVFAISNRRGELAAIELDFTVQTRGRAETGTLDMSGTLHAVGCDPSLVSWLRANVVDVAVDVIAYATADQFLSVRPLLGAGCVFCPATPPGYAELELLRRIRTSNRPYPVIAYAPRADVRAAVNFMLHGAYWFIVAHDQPHETVNAAIREALLADQRSLRSTNELATTLERLSQLTDRQRRYCELLKAGRDRTRIAAALQTTPRKVTDLYRQVIATMQVKNKTQLLVQLFQAQADRTSWNGGHLSSRG